MTRTLGVTGGIGSGKSSVCRILERMGARVFYADEVGRHILIDDPTARGALVELLGPGAYAGDGSLNRAWVARRVFAETALLSRLNEIVHPRVFHAFDRARALAQEEGVALLVKEAALLYESGGYRDLDAILLVDAPESLRIERVTARDPVAPEDVKARMRRQADPAAQRRRADYVISNVGSLDDLARCARAVYRHMLHRTSRSAVKQDHPG